MDVNRNLPLSYVLNTHLFSELQQYLNQHPAKIFAHL